MKVLVSFCFTLTIKAAQAAFDAAQSVHTRAPANVTGIDIDFASGVLPFNTYPIKFVEIQSTYGDSKFFPHVDKIRHNPFNPRRLQR
jgi:hypothetical protein